MRTIKPYGRSHVEPDGAAPSPANKRILRRTSAPDQALDIADFAATHDDLILAHWISAIDKIARKPKMGTGATNDQRHLRKTLGDAAWAYINEHALLPGLQDETQKKHLKLIWQSKIEPYGSTTHKNGREPSPKGRWYQRFCGDQGVRAVDGQEIAQKIHQHLHQAELRMAKSRPNKHQGRIAATAQSIADNTLRPIATLKNDAKKPAWNKQDEATYAAAGDVAKDIHELVQGLVKKRRPVRLRAASAALYKHYALVFENTSGTPLTIRQAQQDQPSLFKLHMAVKDCYTRLLKNQRKKNGPVVPPDMTALFSRIETMRSNQDLNALVRLGKVIYHQALQDAGNGESFLQEHWPTDVAGSRFWTSDGQAEIKRNEAFVRVWRHVLALGARTLKDWADPEGGIGGDILSNTQEAIGKKRFKTENYQKKLGLLFGSGASRFQGSNNIKFQKDVLEFALQKTRNLRNTSFHFKGPTRFLAALQGLAPNNEPKNGVLKAINQLWTADQGAQTQQWIKTLQGAHCDYFFDDAQNHTLLQALIGAQCGALPLPRLRRVLARTDEAWKSKDLSLRLPKPANRQALEHPPRLCQYTSLKLLYERPFRVWLEECTSTTLNGYIQQAQGRATRSARIINGKKQDKETRELIVSRMTKLPKLADGQSIHRFFFNLTAATATEMRVQHGYQSDGAKARDQADYIEDLKCDVVALAFCDYLSQKGFDFILELPSDAQRTPQALCDLDDVLVQTTPTAPVDHEAWQTVLYFVLHLVPVDDVGRLLHQIRKWEILAAPAEGAAPMEGAAPAGGAAIPAGQTMTSDHAQPLRDVLALYLDMHDAKFTGGAALIGTEDYKILFETEDDFNTVFPRSSDDQSVEVDDRRVPRRGLREIMRFGHLPVLLPIFKHCKITPGDIEAWTAAQRPNQVQNGALSAIATQQKTRETLHEKWSKHEKDFQRDGNINAYLRALKAVACHRERAAHVTLTNHVRLHRLLMAVLGRLVDYAGLWERDLTMVTVAVLHLDGLKPSDLFTDVGLEKLHDGQIVTALRETNEGANTQDIKSTLGKYFDVFEENSKMISLRNDFSHFKMLQSAQAPLNLTQCVNDARSLMGYDRKLKNAVSQSIIELLEREGLILSWKMDVEKTPHALTGARFHAKQVHHLGKKKVWVQSKRCMISENLHGENYVKMVGTLFGGQGSPSNHDRKTDVTDWRDEDIVKIKEDKKPQNHRNSQKNHQKSRKNGPSNRRK